MKRYQLNNLVSQVVNNEVVSLYPPVYIQHNTSHSREYENFYVLYLPTFSLVGEYLGYGVQCIPKLNHLLLKLVDPCGVVRGVQCIPKIKSPFLN